MRVIEYHPSKALPSPTHLGSSLDQSSEAEDDSSLVLLDHLDTHVEREWNGGRHYEIKKTLFNSPALSEV